MTYNAAVRGLLIWTVAVGLVQGSGAQTLAPKRPGVQHVTVTATTSAASVPKGGRVTLYADVTPKPAIQVYAAGATDFTPVSLVVTPRAGITTLPVKYPVPDKLPPTGTADPVPVYRTAFRIAQPISLASSLPPGELVTIAGVVNYQACDDRLCYPVASMPVTWTFSVQ